jgi:hypothetical protein
MAKQESSSDALVSGKLSLDISENDRAWLRERTPDHQIRLSVEGWRTNYVYTKYDVKVWPGTQTLLVLKEDSGECVFGSDLRFGPSGAAYRGEERSNGPWTHKKANAFCFLVSIWEGIDFRTGSLFGCRFWLQNGSIGNGGASIRGTWHILENENGPIAIAVNDTIASDNSGSFSQILSIYERVPL